MAENLPCPKENARRRSSRGVSGGEEGSDKRKPGQGRGGGAGKPDVGDCVDDGKSGMVCWMHEAAAAARSARKATDRDAKACQRAAVVGHGKEDEDEDAHVDEESPQAGRRFARAASKARAPANSTTLGKREVRGVPEPPAPPADDGLGKRKSRGAPDPPASPAGAAIGKRKVRGGLETPNLPHDGARKSEDLSRVEPSLSPSKRRRPYQAEPVSTKKGHKPEKKRPEPSSVEKVPESPGIKKEPSPAPSVRKTTRGKTESSPKTSQVYLLHRPANRFAGADVSFSLRHLHHSAPHHITTHYTLHAAPCHFIPYQHHATSLQSFPHQLMCAASSNRRGRKRARPRLGEARGDLRRGEMPRGSFSLVEVRMVRRN